MDHLRIEYNGFKFELSVTQLSIEEAVKNALRLYKNFASVEREQPIEDEGDGTPA